MTEGKETKVPQFFGLQENIQEYPFTKWKCHKFPWKAAILQHQETVFLDECDGDDFSVQTVLLKGRATA